MAINFISSKDSEETPTMHTKSDNTEIIIGSETDEIIGKIFNSFLQRYQKTLEESMIGSKSSKSLNNYWWLKMTLSCCKKIICIS